MEQNTDIDSTEQYIAELPPKVMELWEMYRSSRIAALLGMTGLRGFTEYIERVLDDDEEDSH